MSTPKTKLTPAKIDFFTACRENTGAHFLDSGSAYGRQHERPTLSAKNTPRITWEAGSSATISTPHYLESGWEIDRKVQARFARWAAKEENAKLDWFEAGAQFCQDVLKLVQRGRDNIYNCENDLSQVFVWATYNDGEQDDWVYPDDSTLTVFWIHCGCDVRGGYGRPLFCRSLGDYAIPATSCADYTATALSDDDEHDDLDEHWQAGYSSYPYGELEQDVAEWHEDTRTIDSVEVTLKTGERVIVVARMPYLGG